VSIAAEVATTYTTLRACEAQVEQVRIDAESRAETARLTELTARAGFDSPANAALARASAAQRNAQLVQQITACEVDIKALVALTGWAEPRLRNVLVAARGRVAEPKLLTVPALPADLLRQRPDLASAERNVVAASADIRQREADRLHPSLRGQFLCCGLGI
jgi:outer membrane protein TolC